MTDEEALAILRERRGTMYDPLVVDVFSAAYRRDHAGRDRDRAPGGERGRRRAGIRRGPVAGGRAAEAESNGADAAIATKCWRSAASRALSGNASLSDVGALAWMTLRNVVPATSMAMFVEDEHQDLLTVGYAAGAHAATLRQLKKTRGGGIAGWAAVNRRGVLNAEAALDLGLAAPSLEPPLRASLTVPLSSRRPRRRRALVLRGGGAGLHRGSSAAAGTAGREPWQRPRTVYVRRAAGATCRTRARAACRATCERDASACNVRARAACHVRHVPRRPNRARARARGDAARGLRVARGRRRRHVARHSRAVRARSTRTPQRTHSADR